MTSIKQALKQGTLLLTKSPTATLDAEVLLAHLLNKTRSFLYTHPENPLTLAQQNQYQKWLLQRAQGYPVAYLTQVREFWSLPLSVSPATLIPRPETELLVEITLHLVKNSDATILDLGTGTGAIALALASEQPKWHIHASDISSEALAIAQKNALQLHLNNVQFYCSDWFATLPVTPFHAIIANPPYLADTDPHLQESDIRFEPRGALVADHNGLGALQHIIQYAKDYLLSDGWLLLEHGYMQKKTVYTLLKQAGYEAIMTWQDFQGHDRVTGGRRH